jgi:hypothetical protein
MYKINNNKIDLLQLAKIKAFAVDALTWALEQWEDLKNIQPVDLLRQYDEYLKSANKPTFNFDLRTVRTKLACNIVEAKAKEWSANTFVCCICGRKTYGYGNNPYPLCDIDDYESKCCDECNNTYVIPARIMKIYGGKNGKNSSN